MSIAYAQEKTSAAEVIIIRFFSDKMHLKLDAVGVLFFLEQSGTLREIIDNGPDEYLGVQLKDAPNSQLSNTAGGTSNHLFADSSETKRKTPNGTERRKKKRKKAQPRKRKRKKTRGRAGGRGGGREWEGEGEQTKTKTRCA